MQQVLLVSKLLLSFLSVDIQPVEDVRIEFVFGGDLVLSLKSREVLLVLLTQEGISINPQELLDVKAVGVEKLLERSHLGFNLCLLEQFAVHIHFHAPCKARISSIWSVFCQLISLETFLYRHGELFVLLLKHSLHLVEVQIKAWRVRVQPGLMPIGLESKLVDARNLLDVRLGRLQVVLRTLVYLHVLGEPALHDTGIVQDG